MYMQVQTALPRSGGYTLRYMYTCNYKTTPGGHNYYHYTDLYELSEFDRPILVNIHFFDHVPDLVAGDILSQSFEDCSDLRRCDVSILVSIKLRVCVCVCVLNEMFI